MERLSQMRPGKFMKMLSAAKLAMPLFVGAGLLSCTSLQAHARDNIKDYAGPFTTQDLYTMCSQNNVGSREKCHLYIQGLIYGLNTQKLMQDKKMPVMFTADESRASSNPNTQFHR